MDALSAELERDAAASYLDNLKWLLIRNVSLITEVKEESPTVAEEGSLRAYASILFGVSTIKE